MSEAGGIAMRMDMRSVLVLVVMLAFAGDAVGGSVRLRTTAAVERGAPVTLGMVATLEGADAERLSGIVLLERAEPATEAGELTGEAWVSIDLKKVREAVEAAGSGHALLGYSGDVCLVRLRGVRPSEVAKIEPLKEDTSAQVVDLSGPATVRTRFAGLLCEIYGVEPDDLRLTFAASDEHLLSMSEHGRRIVVRPTSSGSSVRATAEVRVLAGERTIESGTVSAGVEVRRRVLVAGTAIARDTGVQRGMVREVEMWLKPGGGEATSMKEAEGRTVRTAYREGDVLRLGDLESPVVVKRGDLVDVLAMNGGVSVQVKARARDEGRVGDRIELRMEGSRKSFVARVDGPGRAVIVLDAGTPVAGGE